MSEAPSRKASIARTPSRFKQLCRVIVVGVACGLALVAAATLLVGSTLTDRSLWSQYIWWVPRAVLAVAAIPGLFVLLRQPRWKRAFAVVPLLPIVAFVWSDVGIGRWDATAQGIHVLHWNAGWPGSNGGARPATELLARDADLVIVSNPYKLLADGRDDLWREQGYEIVDTGVFLVASRGPILEARLVRSMAGRIAAIIRTDVGQRRLTILAIDLPSSKAIPRADIAKAFKGELANLDQAQFDLVLGDFNITRGSASIATMFPGLRHAWEEAGIGFGGSWPAWLPLAHIDHMLLGAHVDALQYRLFSVGERLHRGQEAHVVLRSRQ